MTPDLAMVCTINNRQPWSTNIKHHKPSRTMAVISYCLLLLTIAKQTPVTNSSINNWICFFSGYCCFPQWLINPSHHHPQPSSNLTSPPGVMSHPQVSRDTNPNHHQSPQPSSTRPAVKNYWEKLLLQLQYLKEMAVGQFTPSPWFSHH